MLRKKLKKRKSSVEGGSLLESLTAQFGKSGHVKKVPTIKSEDISATNIEKEILEDGRLVHPLYHVSKWLHISYDHRILLYVEYKQGRHTASIFLLTISQTITISGVVEKRK